MATTGELNIEKLREIGLSETEIAWLHSFDGLIEKIVRSGEKPKWFPSVEAQKAYWDQTPQYECPKCGRWHHVSRGQDYILCECGANLVVNRDGEFANGGWRDRTSLLTRDSF